MTTQIKKPVSLVHALGVGGVCAAALAGNWMREVMAQDAAESDVPAASAEAEGPLLLAPRVAARPDQSELTESAERNASRFRAQETPAAVAPPPATDSLTAPEISPELQRLRDRMKDCSEYYSQQPENASQRDPWSVMHALIAYGADTELIVGSRRVNAIGWMLWNGQCRGKQLLYLNNGRLAAHVGAPGTQGHAGQLLAMLAQWRVMPETPMKVQDREFTVADFIEYEKKTCQPKTELTFKLIALSYYLKSDETWTDDQGRTWSIPRLIQEELEQPIIGAACGGTHRLMGHAYAVRMREREGRPINGQWLRAKNFLDDYHEYAFSLQNPDGSMSTDWFRGRKDWGDIDRRVQTTGHTLEWLAFSLPKEQLFDPRMVKMATYLTETMIQHRTHNWEIGHKGHALHALNIYLDRAFNTKPEYITAEVAARRRSEETR